MVFAEPPFCAGAVVSLPLHRIEAARQRSAVEAFAFRSARQPCNPAAQAWDELAVRSERADAARIKAELDKLLADTGENPDGGLAAPVPSDTER
ncbi:hypothetical protein ACMGDM_02055 [Sphingomonas sp. DT-51]|uniref:hypothetical protein n=1 Tax=Sphingomonas sp. DT-51 TaxID=3396165 RepID=UPI003F1DC1FA